MGTTENNSKNFKRKKFNIVYLLIIAVAAIIAVSAVWFVTTMRQSVYETQLANMNELAEHDINTIENFLDDNWLSLENSAAKAALDFSDSGKTISKFLREEQVLSTFDELYFIDDHYRIYDTSGDHKSDSAGVKKYYFNEQYVITRYNALDDIYDNDSHEIYSAVKLNGVNIQGHNMIGIVGKFDLNKIQDRIRISSYDGKGYSSVFDNKGKMIMGINAAGHNLKNYFDYLSDGTTLTNKEIREIESNIKAGKSFTAYIEDSYSEETSVVSFKPFESLEWCFITSVPKSVFDAQTRKAFTMFGIMMAIVLIGITGLLVVILITRIRMQRQKEAEQHRMELEASRDLANQQRHIKAFGDMVNAALWSFDINDNDDIVEVHWSDEFRHMFGYEKSLEDFPNKLESWSDMLHPADKEHALKHLEECAKSRDMDNFVYDIQYKLCRKNGEYRWYHAVGRMERTDAGNRRLYGIITDISADKKLEEALTMAEAASTAKTTFLFNMSHDIRTPMNAVIGLSELAEKHLDDRVKIGDYMRQIKVAGKQLLSIINNILEVSRIESNKVQIDEYLVDTDEMFDGLQTVFMNQSRANKLTINFKKEMEHRFLYMDRTHVEEVCINLISNAIKYTPDGGNVDISFVELAGEDADHAVLQVTVKDNGLGMSEEYQSKMFQQFERERSSTVSGIQGTGLGLSIVKRLIDLMHGEITVNSKLDLGTEMIVELPLKIGEAPVDIDPETEEDNIDFEGRRVLLAEDIDVNAIIAQEILGSAGFIVERACDGQECVDMLAAADDNYYDLVLMDIQMPVMDGYRATEEIRRMDNQTKALIPIIAMTANAFAEDRVKALAAGMNDHVGKPIEIDQLFNTVKNVLRYRDFMVDSAELNAFKRKYATQGIQCGYFVYRDDDKETIIYADSEVISMYGCKEGSEFLQYVGRSFRGMVHPDELEAVEAEIHRQQTEGEDGLDFVEYQIIRKDGSVRKCRDVAFRSARGNEHLFYVYIVDITDREDEYGRFTDDFNHSSSK